MEHRLAIAVDLSAATRGEILAAVGRLPGVRSIAADFTSVPAFAGLGSVWDEADAAGITSAWTYTAVMDDATCETCAAADGDVYPSWDEIQTVLPDGGPNPDCDGGGRCRCRAVPEFGDTADTTAAAATPSGPPTPGWLGESAAADLTALRGGGGISDALSAELRSQGLTEADLATPAVRSDLLAAGWTPADLDAATTRTGYLSQAQMRMKAAEQGDAAGFHPYYQPRDEYEAGEWSTPAVRDQHDRLLRVGRSIADEIDSRVAAANDREMGEIQRLSEALDTNRPSVIAADEQRTKIIDDVYNEFVRADRPASDADWRALTDKLNADPRVVEADRALDAAREGQFALTREREAAYARLAEAEKQAYLDALSEIRDFGGSKWTIGRASLDAADLANEAARFYPTDWIDGTGRFDVNLSGERAFFRNRSGSANSYLQTHAKDVETTIHELGHAQEERDDLILDAENVFYNYRTTVDATTGRTGAWSGEQQRVERMGAGYDEWEVTRPDEFFSRYAGKEYPNGRNYELLTMGLQKLWTSPGVLDAEYRAWLLGILAVL
jgi:hypothetical protein